MGLSAAWASLGYFLSAALVLLTRDGFAWYSQEWYAINWKLWPNVISVGVSIVMLLVLSILITVFSPKLHF